MSRDGSLSSDVVAARVVDEGSWHCLLLFKCVLVIGMAGITRLLSLFFHKAISKLEDEDWQYINEKALRTRADKISLSQARARVPEVADEESSDDGALEEGMFDD
ncbi:hypothetical protein CPC08DRAFT_823113 [Agrocybe pediades]|nr:hypothetical protein CPC08DRAFT_823113 [Agrocybe pediades]